MTAELPSTALALALLCALWLVGLLAIVITLARALLTRKAPHQPKPAARPRSKWDSAATAPPPPPRYEQWRPTWPWSR